MNATNQVIPPAPLNYRELLAVTLALQTFVRSRKRFSVLLKVDNITAVAYINNQEGTASKELVALAKDLWMWCLERNIHIQAQYLPGIMNSIADWESRVMKVHRVSTRSLISPSSW